MQTQQETKKRDISFSTRDESLQRVFDNAVAGLKKNLTRVREYSRDVLIEGAEYRGVWLECAPHEGALYGALNAEIARDNHRVFFQN